MLTAIREHSKGWLAGIVIGAIVLTFALFGISSYLEGGAEVPVATVNGEEISRYALENQLSIQRQNYAEQLGENFNPALFSGPRARRQVLEFLIDDLLVEQYLAEQNYRFSDQQLIALIQTIESFQNDGQFDAELYQRLLSDTGLTAQAYEASRRRSGISAQLRTALSESAFVPETELNRLLALQEQTRIAEYALLSVDQLVADIVIDEADALTEYEQNTEQYRAPERLKVDYIELSVDVLGERVTPDEEAVLQLWEQVQGQHKTAESRRASHILFQAASPDDEQQQQAVRAKAESVLAEAEGGADFAELARTHSDDPGSGAQGGDLGVIARDQMVKPFEDAVFAMEKDEIRGLIESDFGYHIIKLTELVPGRQQTLEEVRPEVEDAVRRVEAENLFADFSRSFREWVFEDATSLTAAAEAVGLQVQTSDWFTRESGDGIASEPEVRQTAFAPDVIEEGVNSPVVAIGFDTLIAMRKQTHEPTVIKPFEQVKEEITEKLQLQRAGEQATEQGRQWVEQLNQGAEWAVLTEQAGLSAQPLPEKRDWIPAALDQLGNAVYAHAADKFDAVVYSGVSLSNGDYALYALEDIRPGDLDEIEQPIKDELKQRLLDRDGREMYRQFVAQLRGQADVAVDESLFASDAGADI